jgi:uncharacterized SAM-binding protein YcdF (DUF218 family)
MIDGTPATEFRNSFKREWLTPIAMVFGFAIVLPMVANVWVSGKSAAEKMVTGMAQPLFISILIMLILGNVLLRRRERAIGWILVVTAVAMWCVSTPIFASMLFRTWEAPYRVQTSIPFPLDYVVVLGGGTSKDPNRRPQFSDAGDRVGYAAQLYLTGKAKHLVTTGDVLIVTGTLGGKFEASDDPSNQTKQIWKELGIPEEVVFDLPGQNTSSEMAALKTHPEWWQDGRCAILTSAFHMPRAMKLAERAGVKVVPIAADFRGGGDGPLTLNAFMPNVSELQRVQTIWKEWIALRISR